MFLIEAGFIGLLGGVIGNLLSMLLSFGINTVAGSMGSAMGFEGDISYIRSGLCWHRLELPYLSAWQQDIFRLCVQCG